VFHNWELNSEFIWAKISVLQQKWAHTNSTTILSLKLGQFRHEIFTILFYF